MQKWFLIFVATVICSTFSFAQNTPSKNISVCFTANEMRLYELVMEYRKANNLPTIPLSTSLSYVAQVHCKDLVDNKPNYGDCNQHSWSSKGKWSAVCYTSDHKQAMGMWAKPKELTSYPGYGFEIAFNVWHSDDANYTATAYESLEGWKKSKGHNDVILNKDIWADQAWNAIGIGIYKGYATIWFGREADTIPISTICK